MAARRARKGQARRGRAGKARSLLWLLAMLLLGAALAVGVLMRDRIGAELGLPRPDPAAKAPPPADAPVAQQPSRKPSYDFYTLLPEKEVVIDDRELKVSAQNERKTGKPALTQGVRYLLQAGAWSEQGRAEEMKARIAFTGEIARVEPAVVDGRTVYRVMLGPYADARTLEKAKSRLHDAGVRSIAVRAR